MIGYRDFTGIVAIFIRFRSSLDMFIEINISSSLRSCYLRGMMPQRKGNPKKEFNLAQVLFEFLQMGKRL
jgi:hypothetical protein